ncbi:MAG: hypothetical protein JNK57_02875 [Planctomycetaceae bacterium]|nr:hypothetical protein [Planctomycetaceae bacterium]
MKTDLPGLMLLARGRWVEILTAAGMPSDGIENRRGRPCPKCGGRDRFAAFPGLAERGVVYCRFCFNKNTNPRPGDGLSSLRWWLGVDAAGAIEWLARFLGVERGAAVPRHIERRVRIDDQRDPDPKWAEIADRWFAEMPDPWRARAAERLGLPVAALNRLRVGWAPEHRSTSWPMRDPDGRVIGIRLRCPVTARKWAVVGSAAGLICPVDLRAGMPLWVAEGPTDTAALYSIGLDGVGVPSAGARADWVANLARRLKAPEVIVVADRDDSGAMGAARLVAACVTICGVRVIHPGDGIKDVREWIVGGADADDLRAVADAAPIQQLNVRCHQ